MARMVREKDWSGTALGAREGWPGSLRALVEMVLGQPVAMVLMWGPELVQIYNDGMVEVLGAKHPAGLGMAARECWPEAWPVTGGIHERVWRGESVRLENARFVLSRGGPGAAEEEAYFDVAYGPVRDESGRVAGALATVTETTGRVRAERERARTEESRAAILDSISDGFVVFDRDYRFVYVNPECERILGMSAGELIGRTQWEVFPASVGTFQEREYRRAMDERVTVEFENYFEPWDRWFSLRLFPRADGGGVSVYFRDVTERKRSEAALAEKEQRLREAHRLLEGITEGTQDPIAAIDTGYRYTAANAAYRRDFKRLFGTEVGVGASMLEALAHVPADRESAAELWGKALRGEDVSVTADFGDPKLERRTWDLRFYPLRDAGGRVVGAGQIATDVTDRRVAEEERERLLRVVGAERATMAAVIEQAPSFVCVMRGPELVVEMANAKYLEVVGGRPMAGRTIREALPEIEGQGFFELLDGVYRTGATFAKDEMPATIRRGGVLELRYVNLVYQALRDADGTVTGVYAHGVDVTDLVRSREAARASAERFRAAFEQSQVGIVESDVAGRVVRANPAFCRMVGRSEEELVGRDSRSYTHPEDVAGNAAGIGEVASGASPGRVYEKRYVRPDGEVVWAQVSLAAVRDGRGDVSHLVAVVEDATERRRAAEALRGANARLEERVRVIADAVPHIVWVTGSDGYHEYFNRGWYEYVGLGFDETKGDGWERVVHPDDLAHTLRAWRHSMATGEAYGVEYRLRRRDGAYRWFLGRALPARDASGRIVQWYGTCTDIHDHKEFTEQRERLLESERGAKEAAEEANRAKDRFLAVLSHELRTPLSPVLMTASAMEGDPELPERFRDDVLTIRRNVELETKLIDDLLDLSRIASGKLRLASEGVRLHELLRHVLEVCAADLLGKGLRIVFDLRATGDGVVGDAARLQQVFWNLLKNAVKFSPVGGSVVLRTRDVEGGRVRVSVEDNGVGIPANVLPRVFDAFEQGDPSVTRQFGGLGLGLAISKGIVELHGGAIWAASDGEGRGAVFTVELPCAAVGGDGAAAAPGGAPAMGIASAGNLRILLVEDHADTARTLSRLLARSGSTVTTAGSVAEGVRVGRAEAFDLLISDIGLPDGSGLDLMRELRGDGLRGIALSGFGMDEDVERSRAVGFAEHLTKPVNLRDLGAAIERVMKG